MRFNFELTKPPTNPLRPINPGNAWGLCITATAGTELVTPYSSGTVCPPPISPINLVVSTTRAKRLRLSLIILLKLSEKLVGDFLPNKRCLQPEGLHPSRNVAPSGFRPLRKILDCSLP